MTVPKNRVRAKAPKTKTGCKTCRKRHIKCDETRPACQKCTSSGWTCDGYATAVDPGCISTQTDATHARLTINIMSSRPWYLPLLRLGHLEGLAFTFFRHHTAAQLQDSLQSQLWSRWAMQISHQEPAVMHAIIAVGSLHQARSESVDLPSSTVDASSFQQFALKHYSTAVIELRSRIESLGNKLEIGIVLLSCLLFVGFEMLQHDVSVAMDHLRLGLGVICDRYGTSQARGKVNKGAIMLKKTPTGPLDELVPVFVRLDHAAPMFGRRHPLVDFISEDTDLDGGLIISKSFESVTEAKSNLDVLTSGVFRLCGQLMAIAEEFASSSQSTFGGPARYQCYIQALSRSVDLGCHHNEIVARKRALEAGIAAFSTALKRLAGPLDELTDRSIMAIQIQYVLVFFTITNCREIHESTCDGFTELFETTIELAERFLLSAPRYANLSVKRSLSMEPGIIPSIFLVASKCRDLTIRAKAIYLLQEACMQEAIWDGKPFAAFMQRFAELEEATRISCIDCGDSALARLSIAEPNPATIPEYGRFSDVVVADELDEAGRGRLVCARYRHDSDGLIELTEHIVNLSQSSLAS